MVRWSKWRPFPDPLSEGVLVAPIGPGVYELRNVATDEAVLFGRSDNCAHRISSLLPDGPGTRKNTAKQKYVQRHLASIEYRTRACRDHKETVVIEASLKRRGGYRFPT